jgi:hypothetical protein
MGFVGTGSQTPGIVLKLLLLLPLPPLLRRSALGHPVLLPRSGTLAL